MPVHIVQQLSSKGLERHIPMERVHPDDLVALQSLLQHPEIQESKKFEFRTADAYGAWNWFELRVQLLDRTAPIEANQCIGVLTDITERQRQAEHAALQQRFFQVLAQSPDRPTLIAAMLDTVLALSDLDGGGLYWERGDGGFDLVASRGLSHTFLEQTGNIGPNDPRAGIIHAGNMV